MLPRRQCRLENTFVSSRDAFRVAMLASSQSPRVSCGCNRGARRQSRRVLCAAAPVVREAEKAAASPEVVFVAGATGRTGLRVVRSLLASGYAVRAGVRDAKKAAEIFSGRALPPGVGYTGAKDQGAAVGLDMSRITSVECDVTQPTSLGGALGDASFVVSCLGAPESGALSPDNPRRIDGEGTIALVHAAKASGVKHFVLVSSLGTGRFGWPASVLNLFWNVLEHKRTAELALINSGMPFTIVRPGGMERPTDDFEDTHGIVLCAEDTTFGGQVSRKQVAQLAVHCLSAPAEACNKVVEVIASKGVPLRPLSRQLEALPAVAALPQGQSSSGVYTAKYAYVKPPTVRVLDLMGFGGSAPEVVNARAAMIAAAVMLWAEAHGGGTLAQQCSGTGVHSWAEAVVEAVAAASLPPLLRGVAVKHANLGPFTASAELLNGRLAMLALAGAGALEAVHGVPVMTHPWPFY